MLYFLSSLLAALTAALTVAVAHFQQTTYPHCDRTFSCGTITNVTYPFTGGDRPSHCGPPEFTLTCRNSTITELTDGELDYRVLQLHQTHRILILSRSDIYTNPCPASEFHNTTLNYTLFSYDGPLNENLTMFYGCDTSAMGRNSTPPNSLFSCTSRNFNHSDAGYWIGPVPSDPGFWGFRYCSISVGVPVLKAVGDQETGLQLSLGEAVRQGFSVSYSIPYEGLCFNCTTLGGLCGFDSISAQPICICVDRPCPFDLTLPVPFEGSKKWLSHLQKYVIIGLSVGLAFIATSFLVLFCIRKQYRLYKQDQESNQNIEKLTLNHGSLAPKRYNHNEIKKITKSFSDKIGQGGYGIVYKGKLPDGQPVAVKVLTETGENAEDFINEVASISRTSHVNIVNLLGFCNERNKRALVYEFMPNKSLDNFISNNNNNNKSRELEWGDMYGVAVGVARGLEYLHRGCNTRIVHFDIKPQNILLDEDLCPKISDFGLAKLFRKKQSMISMLGARGTIGYIAPEVFSRSFGIVSHKSDVYSYGMMLLEMVGAKKAVEMEGDRSNEFFHDKIYEHVLFENGKLDDLTADDKETSARKMLLTGIWCIQIAPSDRPSMTKVVEMLEGTLQSIQIPPKPFIYSPKFSAQSSSLLSATSLERENTNEG